MSNYIPVGVEPSTQDEKKPGLFDRATGLLGSVVDFLRFRKGESGSDFCLQPQNFNSPMCRPPESPWPKILLIGGAGVVVYLLVRKKKIG